MLKIAAILSQLDIFEKFPTKIKNKKRITNYFARKVIINDLKTWVFAEIVCCRNQTREPKGEYVQSRW